MKMLAGYPKSWLAVLAVGPLFILLGLGACLYTEIDVLRSVQVDGTVVTNTPGTRGWDNKLLHPSFVFLGKDGMTHTATLDDPAKPGTFEVGQRVPVVYRPEAPEKADINSLWTIWEIPLIPLFFGVPITGLCLWIVMAMNRSRRRAG